MIIQTERLILREIKEDDWLPVLEYQSDPLYLKYTHWETRNERDVKEFIGMFIHWQRENPRRKFQLAITKASNGALIGNCGIRKQDSGDRVAELGYEIAPIEWQKGYATEAASAMLSFAFLTLKLQRVWAYCIADNVASARVLEKIGMDRERLQQQQEWFKGLWWDVAYYGIFEKDWKEENGMI